MKRKKWDLETLASCKKELMKRLATLNTLDIDEDTRVLNWKKLTSELDAIETLEESIQEALKGKLKGEIKGEIKMIKALSKYNVPQKKIIAELEFLTEDKVKDQLESNLKYIKEHPDDSDSEICNELGLVGSLADFNSDTI